MNLESPPQKVIVNESPPGLEIVISASRNPTITMAYPLLIIIWGVVGYSIMLNYFDNEYIGNKSALLVGLVICFLFCALIIHSWVYNLVGKERIRINHQYLSVKLDIYGFGITRNYDLRHVSRFRPEERRGSFTPFLPGHFKKIVFNYKDDTCGFGVFRDEAQAQAIVNKLQMHHDGARRSMTSS